ncbi:MAG TPA: YkoF family thiamine/hydroxymethylpyrimidine-binding protein [Steroidobacteraceae bacterium]|nr:YkoF family thiamine/hydroxymethylpyrimidine-binding protein [Steroidobacteraceae bacterium]
MEIGVEISLYPLAEQFVPQIHDFIARVSAAGELKVVSGSLSTQIFGEYERVFETLRRELRATFDSRGEQGGKAAFVLKVLGPL